MRVLPTYSVGAVNLWIPIYCNLLETGDYKEVLKMLKMLIFENVIKYALKKERLEYNLISLPVKHVS